MPNTFLNTSRTIAVTNNPQANVAQVNNTASQVPQVPQSTISQTPASVNQSQQNSFNGISPITIPIQLQPVTPTQGIAPVSNNNLQAISTNNNQNAVISAPTPQTYDPSSTNNNVVDFNQIYEAYQSQYGNNQQNTNSNVNSSGVKKTVIGTNIITPTTNNLNSVEGRYQSQYADTMNGLLGKMLEQITKMENGSFYDPTTDKALQAAAEYAANSTLQSLAGSGVLNSSATAERIARVVSGLIPEYEKLAYERQMQLFNQLATTASFVQKLDAQEFEYWKDEQDRKFQEKQFEFQKEQQELENAWKRVDELGYVDNEAAAVLGVKAGTLSGQARENKEQREFELQKMREQARLEHENDVALAELRSQLDKENLEREYELKKDYANHEYNLQQKYSTSVGGSSSSTSSSKDNFSRYDEIIKNKYVTQDPVTGQYIATNEQKYNELGDYLDSLYANGLISYETFCQLAAKYSNYDSSENIQSESNTNASNAGLNDSNVNTWIKALDGNNKALEELGVTIFGQKKSMVNNNDAKKAVKEALKQIKEGKYPGITNQELMNKLKNGDFGHLGWGF